MKILFLSHSPHEAHLGFAEAVGARVKILPLEKFARAIQAYPVIGGGTYALLSFLRGLCMREQADILIVDGGLPIPTAFALKKKYKDLKIIYLDADLFLYSLRSRRTEWGTLLHAIDGIISVSEEHKKHVPSFINVPIRICPPYPKDVRDRGTPRKNYGLYVGRLDPDKNIKRIIDFGLQCPYFEKFIVVGDGLFRPRVLQTALKNNKLQYVGWQKNVEEYYNLCSFLIHIPDHDPHPTATMEAALCGCFPVISGGVGTKYLFDEIFIVNDPNNFDEINQKIKFVLDHKDAARALLQEAVKKIPRKDDSLRCFRKAFFEIIRELS